MSKQQAWILIVIAAVAVGALIHMNRYEYLEPYVAKRGTYLVRIDHLTGQQCVASLPLGINSKSERKLFFRNIDISPC